MATGASTPRRRDPGPGAPRLLRPYENCRSPRGPPAHETPGRTSSEPSRSPPSNPKESYLGGDGPKTIPHLRPSWPRSRSTSPAPPEPWPRSSTPRRPPPRSAPNSSPFPGASPARPARSTSTCHGVGPGNTPGKTCSPPPAGLPARQPDHPTPTAQRTTPRGRTGQTGRFLMPERENPQTVDDHTPTEIQSVHPGSVVRSLTVEPAGAERRLSRFPLNFGSGRCDRQAAITGSS